VSSFPWNFILSPGFMFKSGVSKMISSAVWLWSLIVVLELEVCIDSTVAVWTGFVWVRKIRRSIAMRDRRRVNF